MSYLQYAGVVTVLLGYWLTCGRTRTRRSFGHLFSFTGAVALLVVAADARLWGFFALNCIWSVIAMERLMRRHT